MFPLICAMHSDEISSASAGSNGSSRYCRSPGGTSLGGWTLTKPTHHQQSECCLDNRKASSDVWVREGRDCLECGTLAAPDMERASKNTKPWDMSHVLQLPCSLLRYVVWSELVTRVKTTQGHMKLMCHRLSWMILVAFDG